MKQMTFEQYRSVDITIWTAMIILFEAITTLATTQWFYSQPVAMSISLALICAVMMRWDGYAAIQAVVGGFVFCIISGATIEQYFIYCIGNVFTLVALVLIKIWGKEKIRESAAKLTIFVVFAYIGMIVGRWGVSLFFGGDFMALVVYATTDIISLLFAIIVLNLLRKTDGMIEDQKSYLFRIEREQKEENNYEMDDHLL